MKFKKAGSLRQLADAVRSGVAMIRAMPNTPALVRLGVAAISGGPHATEDDLAWAESILDPGALTIGFARRFATYKRATLLFRDPDRLVRLVSDPDRDPQRRALRKHFARARA